MADLYDPSKKWTFPNLAKAYHELDATIEASYGIDLQSDKEKVIANPIKLYAELTNE